LFKIIFHHKPGFRRAGHIYTLYIHYINLYLFSSPGTQQVQLVIWKVLITSTYYLMFVISPLLINYITPQALMYILYTPAQCTFANRGTTLSSCRPTTVNYLYGIVDFTLTTYCLYVQSLIHIFFATLSTPTVRALL